MNMTAAAVLILAVFLAPQVLEDLEATPDDDDDDE